MIYNSRTKKSFKNAKFALVFYLINLLLTFLSRKVFIDYLGTEILGLNTTAATILGFLNISELGIGIAISYSLYKPLFNFDKIAINEIVSVQGFWYRKVGNFVLGGAIVIMLFFPLIFQKADIPLWYSYATFIVFLMGSLLGYYWNYKQILLTADQKDYKITLNRQSWISLKVILQIIAITQSNHGYIYWIIIEFAFACFITISLNYIIRKEYPWLNSDPNQGKILQNKYPAIIIKTKQLIFHKIGGFVLTQTSPLVIYAFSSLTVVAVYGNYLLITIGVSALLNAIFNSVGAGIGNLVAEGNKERIQHVFWELFSIRFILVTTFCIAIYWYATPFITFWIGKQFVFEEKTLILILTIMYINSMRNIVDLYINAYGLYNDVWATVVESVINLALSIVLGYYYGLNGILLGVLISLALMVFIWKPYFCFKYGIKTSFWIYIYIYLKHVIVSVIVFLPLQYLYSRYITIDTATELIYKGGTSVVIVFILMASVSYLSLISVRNFSKRILAHKF